MSFPSIVFSELTDQVLAVPAADPVRVVLAPHSLTVSADRMSFTFSDETAPEPFLIDWVDDFCRAFGPARFAVTPSISPDFHAHFVTVELQTPCTLPMIQWVVTHIWQEI